MNLIPLLPEEKDFNKPPLIGYGAPYEEGFNACLTQSIQALPAIEQAVRDAVLEEVKTTLLKDLEWHNSGIEKNGRQVKLDAIEIIDSLKTKEETT
jgi:hypothetical protein